jgi:hypothetical protein
MPAGGIDRRAAAAGVIASPRALACTQGPQCEDRDHHATDQRRNMVGLRQQVHEAFEEPERRRGVMSGMCARERCRCEQAQGRGVGGMQSEHGVSLREGRVSALWIEAAATS